jgi:serine O-acetyltransferase
MSQSLVDFLYQERYQKAPFYLNVSELRCMIHEIILLLYPQKRDFDFLSREEMQAHLNKLTDSFEKSVLKVGGNKNQVKDFFDRLPLIAEKLDKDALASVDGDPAARSLDEVVLTYPGFYALCVYRLAHQLHLLQVPLIPRIMSEYAHEKTGIDIHPGAEIGEKCFIDHGTGVVIGETSEIGNSVKIYQGVTLGALSVKKKMKGKKRHPTIEDNVILYANSTILGGETKVGHHSIIGGNVWLTSSTEPYSTILHQEEKKG